MTKKIYLETFKKCPGSLCFTLLSPIATYSNINCDDKILNNESTEVVKNKTLPNDNIGKGDRKK